MHADDIDDQHFRDIDIALSAESFPRLRTVVLSIFTPHRTPNRETDNGGSLSGWLPRTMKRIDVLVEHPSREMLDSDAVQCLDFLAVPSSSCSIFHCLPETGEADRNSRSDPTG